MYFVQILVPLLAHDGILALSRWLILPFAPFPGLGLYGLTSEPDRPETVDAVSWDTAGGYFLVELEGDSAPGERIADLVDYFGRGWQLHEPGFEPAEGR